MRKTRTAKRKTKAPRRGNRLAKSHNFRPVQNQPRELSTLENAVCLEKPQKGCALACLLVSDSIGTNTVLVVSELTPVGLD